MKTRIISFILILMFSATLAMAQSMDKAKTSFAILGGINVQNLNGKDMDGNKLKNDLIFGYHLGMNVQIPIAQQFFFQPGLLFSTKGAKDNNGSLTNTYKLSYIELPLNVVYKALLGKGSFMLGFGPYIGYAIGGKVITEGGSERLETNIEFKNVVEENDPFTVTYFKSFDAGGNVFVGYELVSGIFFQLNTQFGMVKINPEDRRISNDNSSIKNTGYGLSLGYRF